MRIILIGANGTIGKHVRTTLEEAGTEVVSVGRTSGDHRVDIESPESLRELYEKIGRFDAVAVAAGEVEFAPPDRTTRDLWNRSVRSKLLGQVNVVQEALPFIGPSGSFTLISGILSELPIKGGAIATSINRAVEGYASTVAHELPGSLRINVVSPTLLEESFEAFRDSFPGIRPTSGRRVAAAYERSIFGIESGKIFRVFE